MKENDLLELKQKLQDVHTSIADETGAVGDVVFSTEMDTQVQCKIQLYPNLL